MSIIESHRNVPAVGTQTAPPVVDIVIPVHNEEHVLDASISRLHDYLRDELPYAWRITIADNASIDGTWRVAQSLAALYPNVRALHLDRKGRGLALRTAWSQSDAAVVAYMDVDLSTGLDAVLPLVAPLVSGHSDVAIGSRLASGAAVARGPKRELISRSYNAILRTVFAARFRDAQCGFKAVRADVARRLLPEIEDDAWFFDTELLLLAEHNGLRIHEVPVDWIDDPDSRVRIVNTATQDLLGVARVARRFAAGRGRIDLGAAGRAPLADDMGRQFVSFGIIGTICTAISLAAFLATRATLGAWAASLLAVTLTVFVNGWANRRYTLARRGPGGRLRDHAGGLAAYVLALAGSTAALGLVAAAGGRVVAEVAALAVVWAAAAVVRFSSLRRLSAEARS